MMPRRLGASSDLANTVSGANGQAKHEDHDHHDFGFKLRQTRFRDYDSRRGSQPASNAPCAIAKMVNTAACPWTEKPRPPTRSGCVRNGRRLKIQPRDLRYKKRPQMKESRKYQRSNARTEKTGKLNIAIANAGRG